MHIIAVTALLTGFLDLSSSQCSGSAQDISSGDATIQSPNYPDEYGESASCTWNFMTPPEGNHLLQLTITAMKLYFKDTNNGTYCPGSYELAIAGETLDCTRFVNDTDRSTQFCIAFNSSCTSEQSPCESVRRFTSAFEVTYDSNGETFGNQTVVGFRIEYKYTNCTRTITATTSTTTSALGVPRELSLAIGLGVATGLLLIVTIAIVGYYLYRRKKSPENGPAVIFSNTRDTAEGQYENDTIPRERSMKPPNSDLRIYVNETALRHPAALRNMESGSQETGYNDDIQL